MKECCAEAYRAGRAEMREEAAKVVVEQCPSRSKITTTGVHPWDHPDLVKCSCIHARDSIRSLPTAKSAKPPHVCYHWHTNGRCVVCGEPKPGGEALPLPEFPSKDPSDHPYEDWLTNKERADYPAVPPSRCIRCGYPAGVHGR